MTKEKFHTLQTTQNLVSPSVITEQEIDIASMEATLYHGRPNP